MISWQAGLIKFITIVLLKLSFLGVVLRGKKEEGALAKVKKIKKRLSQSFGKLCKFSKILFSLTPLGFEAVNLSTNVFNFDQQFCFSSRQILNCAAINCWLLPNCFSINVMGLYEISNGRQVNQLEQKLMMQI